MTGCGADSISEMPYSFSSSDLVLNGCGSELAYIPSGFAVMRFSNARIVMNACTGASHRAAASGTPYYLDINSGARVVINAGRLENWFTAGAGFNLRLSGRSNLVTTEALLPANGNPFIAYTGGSTWIDTKDGKTEWRSEGKTLSSDTFVRVAGGSPTQLVINNKTVADAGSNILTVTLADGTGSSKANVFLDITVYWHDGTFANGLGISKLTLICNRTGANYYQEASVYHETRAGNGLTGYPAFSVTRSGDVWTLAMTPANGTLSADFNITTSQRANDSSTFTFAAV
jgi:hypothetical protein